MKIVQPISLSPITITWTSGLIAAGNYKTFFFQNINTGAPNILNNFIGKKVKNIKCQIFCGNNGGTEPQTIAGFVKDNEIEVLLNIPGLGAAPVNNLDLDGSILLPDLANIFIYFILTIDKRLTPTALNTSIYNPQLILTVDLIE